MHGAIADSSTVVARLAGDRRWSPVQPKRDLAERIATDDAARDLLSLDKGEPQLRTNPITGLQASNSVEQSLHRLRCAMNRVASLLKRLAGRDAPTNLEPFLSGQSQTICSARHCQATLRSSRTHHAALQRPLEIEGSGSKVTNAELAAVPLDPHDFHGE